LTRGWLARRCRGTRARRTTCSGNHVTGRKLSDAELREALEQSYERIISEGWIDREPSGTPVGRGALWSQHSDHRFIHFKDGAAWRQYAKDFGNPDPYAAMMGHISTM